ncbi:MAG: hypothetical protein LBQ18_06290 [Campylobacteraceae bacterium]|jgi:hypothetical protein|nr:hypothetical protein [Campylobacteraceae bacterium]
MNIIVEDNLSLDKNKLFICIYKIIKNYKLQAQHRTGAKVGIAWQID